MRQYVTPGLLWFSAVGCGLMAGVYFAFSAFVMTSFARLGPAAGMAAMNSINVEIVKSTFMPLFLGTTLTAAAAVVLAFLRWGEPGSMVMLAGGAIYVVGMFLVTMICNVPLNDALAAVDLSSAEGASLWARYLREWTFWNHARTAASIGSTILFVVAITAK